MIPDESPVRYVKGLYPLAVLLTFAPLMDMAVRTWPFQPTLLQWRFGFFVALISNFAIILTGLGLLGGVAAFSGHRVMLRVVSVLSALGALFGLAVLVLFALDALQARKLSDAAASSGLLRGLASGTITSSLSAAAMAGIAWGAHRAAEALSRAPRRPAATTVRSPMTGAAPAAPPAAR